MQVASFACSLRSDGICQLGAASCQLTQIVTRWALSQAIPLPAYSKLGVNGSGLGRDPVDVGYRVPRNRGHSLSGYQDANQVERVRR